MWKYRLTQTVGKLAGLALFLQGCPNTSTPKTAIENGSIAEIKYATGSVSTRALADSAISTAKLADYSVTAIKMDPTIALSGSTGTFTGNVTVGGTLGVTGNFAVNTNKFTVAASSGNTSVAGTLGVTGDFAVNTNKFTVAASSGNTSIAGTTTLADTLTVTKATTTAGDVGLTNFGIKTTFTINPTAAVTAGGYWGSYNYLPYTSAQNSVAPLVGSLSHIDNGNTGTLTLSYGAQGISENSAAGSITTAAGVVGRAKNSAAGTITYGMGVYGDVYNEQNGNITGGSAIQGAIYNDSTGIITTGFALRGGITNTSGDATKVVTYHGLHLDDPAGKATTIYNIYSDGNVNNYIEGNLGLNQENPAALLDVNGTVKITGAVTLTGTGATGAGDTFLCLTAGGVVTTGATCAASDRRLKDRIEPVQRALAGILKLNGVTFNWKEKSKGQERQMGLIAQDVQQSFPEGVHKIAGGFLGVNYNAMIGPIVEAIKEFHAKWLADHKLLEEQGVLLGRLEKKLEQENVALKAENKALRERLDKIEQALAHVSPEKNLPQKKNRNIAQLK